MTCKYIIRVDVLKTEQNDILSIYNLVQLTAVVDCLEEDYLCLL